jgi:hypothetical protein
MSGGFRLTRFCSGIRKMAGNQVLLAVQNINARLTQVEQILPTLATRDELHAAIAPLATREEMYHAIQTAVAPLATREEMHAALTELADQLRAEIKEEGERARRHTDVLIEDLRDDNRLILEHLISLSARVDALAQR